MGVVNPKESNIVESVAKWQESVDSAYHNFRIDGYITRLDIENMNIINRNRGETMNYFFHHNNCGEIFFLKRHRKCVRTIARKDPKTNFWVGDAIVFKTPTEEIQVRQV